jgi:tRNA nucleotidyltransferase (CCA-adding enzyme)
MTAISPISPYFDTNLPLYPLIAYVAQTAEKVALPTYLVGGYVRDVLLGRISFDLDFVTEGDAHRLAQRFEGVGHVHLDRFGTAHWTVAPELLRDLNITFDTVLTVDFATARTESYAHHGALPTIHETPATLAQDLQRRDFTINALALRFPDLTLIEVPGGLADLREARIRVLHERSFHDDPTRIFRAARYTTRFQFTLDSETEALIPAAVPLIDQLSGERIAEEFRRIFDEADPFPALTHLQEWGVLHQIDPSLRISDEMRGQFQRLRTAGMAREVADWCILLYPMQAERILKRLELSRLHIDSILKTQKMVDTVQTFSTALKPSSIVKAIETIENREQGNQIVCEAAWAIAPSDLLLDYRGKWRQVRPTLTGDDLKAAGLRPGPLFGTILDRLRAAWLDGEIQSATEERALFERLRDKG